MVTTRTACVVTILLSIILQGIAFGQLPDVRPTKPVPHYVPGPQVAPAEPNDSNIPYAPRTMARPPIERQTTRYTSAGLASAWQFLRSYLMSKGLDGILEYLQRRFNGAPATASYFPPGFLPPAPSPNTAPDTRYPPAITVWNAPNWQQQIELVQQWPYFVVRTLASNGTYVAGGGIFDSQGVLHFHSFIIMDRFGNSMEYSGQIPLTIDPRNPNGSQYVHGTLFGPALPNGDYNPISLNWTRIR